ncbi:unnamed protein product [Miscanthus lutarioriparius]|uniref:Uncharacterized protein n=1 Tax=Miscanthus lutarioriparius TaxID=422564 RepID=A0A811QDS9_9POAL|nr:unnamed protein product [Miscanthus lutarioriparius]
MSSEQKSDAHGGYFVGHPTNHAAEKTEEPPHAAGDQNPVTAQTPGGRFMLCRFSSFIHIKDPDMHTSLFSFLDLLSSCQFKTGPIYVICPNLSVPRRRWSCGIDQELPLAALENSAQAPASARAEPLQSEAAGEVEHDAERADEIEKHRVDALVDEHHLQRGLGGVHCPQRPGKPGSRGARPAAGSSLLGASGAPPQPEPAAAMETASCCFTGPDPLDAFLIRPDLVGVGDPYPEMQDETGSCFKMCVPSE